MMRGYFCYAVSVRVVPCPWLTRQSPVYFVTTILLVVVVVVVAAVVAVAVAVVL